MKNGEFVKSGSIYYAHMSVNGREITLINLEMIKVMDILM